MTTSLSIFCLESDLVKEDILIPLIFLQNSLKKGLAKFCEF